MFESIYHFILFLLFAFLSLSGAAFLIFIIITIIDFGTRIYEKVAFIKLENRIKRNPNIGLKDEDGNFVFHSRRFTIKYRVVGLGDDSGQKKIELVKMTTRLMRYDWKIKNFKFLIRRFWAKRDWMYFFRSKSFSFCSQ